MIKEDEMPLSPYLVGHPGAALSIEQKDKIIFWSNGCMDEMKAAYPADSLLKK